MTAAVRPFARGGRQPVALRTAARKDHVMPLYDYNCTECGPFTELRSMSRSSEPMHCPVCRNPARRSLTAPFIADMDPNNRIAHQRNEKSAHEPGVVSGKPPGRGHGHAAARARRPWAIGH